MTSACRHTHSHTHPIPKEMSIPGCVETGCRLGEGRGKAGERRRDAQFAKSIRALFIAPLACLPNSTQHTFNPLLHQPPRSKNTHTFLLPVPPHDSGEAGGLVENGEEQEEEQFIERRSRPSAVQQSSSSVSLILGVQQSRI